MLRQQCQCLTSNEGLREISNMAAHSITTLSALNQLLTFVTTTLCLGTVRANLTGGAGDRLKTDKELCKEGRGVYDYRSSGGVIAVKWYDNKCVTLLINACGVEPVGFVQRYSKEQGMKIAVTCPAIIKAYNEHIGGMDLSDMLVHLYKSQMKSKRWYLPLFGYVLDLSVCNAWVLYRQDCSALKEKPMPLKRFSVTVAHTLEGLHKMPSRIGRPLCTSPPPAKLQQKPKLDETPVADVHFDNTSHWPTCGPQRGRCRFCPKGVSRKCEVFLCLNTAQQCFVAYHMK
ncbi:hypothetical protein M9458_008952 [Cirrhinus mrigala]|uniref:PiggyBac transposable element-derived protein domain-containing protein n=1 Tax=Cirrhinus mrigala TaxID=683832 RepID=A0ABD0RCU5_CIRMR